ncbi:hypothetical protein [Bacillus velezensis]|uniref:hypothetical protein n=1 Tax=Bacillus velezensis TaxID=492670 RepID=UPI0011A4A7E8|nr:hypothetical protein [Bacillus velezensis]
MFKITCENCGRESRVIISNGAIETDGDVHFGIGDGTIDTVHCVGCRIQLESEKWSDVERMEVEAEQEMIEKVERENWMYANDIKEDY